MKTVREKAYAKINLFLDIVGVDDVGYHMLDSVVSTISLFDSVTVTKRKDDKIVLKTAGSLYSITDGFDNNAYKAAKLLQETYQTLGVDITLNKNIPVASGLGGSSADIAGVLKAMKKLFAIKEDIKPLADKLGSDSGYLLTGGFARLTGRGEIVEELELTNKLYLVIAVAKGGVNTADCYKEFDNEKTLPKLGGALNLIENLSKNQIDQNDFYNALYLPATKINQKVKELYEDMKALSPKAVAMSGSGSSVFAVFDSFELTEWARLKLKKKYKDVFTAQTLTKDEMLKGGLFAKSPYRLEEDEMK